MAIPKGSQLSAPKQYTSGEWRQTASGVKTNNPYFDGYSTGTPVAQPGVSSAAGISGSYVPSVSSGLLGSGSSLSGLMSMIQKVQADNNAWSAAQVQKQMDFQTASADKAMAFNADQAKLSREWQEYMSSTAHQREIKDLKAAGLNPVLSAMGGNGAPVTSGATASGYTSEGAAASPDTSLAPALVSLIGTMMTTQASMANSALSAKTQESVADKYNAMSKYVSELQSQTTLNSATISALASRYSSDQYLAGTKYASDKSAAASRIAASINAAAQKYGYDVSAMTQKQIASFNAQVSHTLKEMDIQHDFDIREAYPNNLWNALGSIFSGSGNSDVFGEGVGGLANAGSSILRKILSFLPDASGITTPPS